MTTALSFLFVLGVLVFAHELGHFAVARWHGVRVLTFSLGFGPKLFKFTRGGTEYCVSVVPIGGYVKMAGETVDDVRTGAPDEFLSKSKWIRFQVYIAGPAMSILLAIVVLAGVRSQGANVPLYESSKPVIGTVKPNSVAAQAGIRVGDLVTSVDGVPVPTWDAFDMAIKPHAKRELSLMIERDGQSTEIRVTPASLGKYEMGDLGVDAILRPQITHVNPGPAMRAGIQEHDVIVAVEGTRALSYKQVKEQIQRHSNKPLRLTLERGGKEMDVVVTPEGPEGAGLINVGLSEYEMKHIDPSVPQAIKMSLQENWAGTLLIGKTIRGIFTRDTPVRQLMGPVAIAEMSGTAAEMGWTAIFNLMAMLSLNLGLVNLVPVPVLDGGQIAILAIEGVRRRDLTVRVKERIFMAGLAVIALLMVTVFYNDIARLLR
jgi:regulator of sigma E protease